MFAEADMGEFFTAVELTAAWLMLYPHRTGPAKLSSRVLIRRQLFLQSYSAYIARIAEWNRAINTKTGGF